MCVRAKCKHANGPPPASRPIQVAVCERAQRSPTPKQSRPAAVVSSSTNDAAPTVFRGGALVPLPLAARSRRGSRHGHSNVSVPGRPGEDDGGERARPVLHVATMYVRHGSIADAPPVDAWSCYRSTPVARRQRASFLSCAFCAAMATRTTPLKGCYVCIAMLSPPSTTPHSTHTHTHTHTHTTRTPHRQRSAQPWQRTSCRAHQRDQARGRCHTTVSPTTSFGHCAACMQQRAGAGADARSSRIGLTVNIVACVAPVRTLAS